MENDADALSDIYSYYVEETTISFETVAPSSEEMRERIKEISGRYPFIVTEENGIIQGYAYAHKWKDRSAYDKTAELTIYLRHGITGKGLGSRLLTKLIDECRACGLHVLVTCITDNNEASLNLSRKFGFSQASHFHEVGIKFGQRLGVIDFELLLE